MSFSYKTENIGLPIWGSNDKPTQDDLNYQNNKIDKKFNEKPFHNISELKNTNGNFLSLESHTEPISKICMYFLKMKDQYDKNAILRINCGVIFDVYYGPYDTTIHFIPYDWFSGDINDIIVQCITKEGE
jgi:hypothetical protein